MSVLYSWTITNPGNITGSRYNVYANGVLDATGRGTTFFPGSTVGTSGVTGGQYLS